MNVPRWTGAFAALVFHGGGQPPGDVGRDTSCPTSSLPSYFLVGDRNTAHAATKRLRSYLERCRQDVTWDLLPGAGHKREEQALDQGKASKILDWLEARSLDPRVS